MNIFFKKYQKRKTIFSGLVVLGVIAVFTGIYIYFASGYIRQVMIYFLIPVGLYLSISWLYSAVLINTFGIILLIVRPGCWPWPALVLAALLVGTTVIPFYYEKLSMLSRLIFRKKNAELKQRATELENALFEAEKRRSAMEEEINKINQLYILGRELVEHVELEDVLEHLQRILLSRPGISNVAVFAWEKNNWKILSSSDPELREKLLEFIGSRKELRLEKGIRQLETPPYLSGKSIVFWPIRLEKDLMAGVLIIVENESTHQYMEEGDIFIPQIALGLRRTRLFAEVQDRSRVDGLTGLYLRRYFIERMQTEIQRAKRYSGIFSVLMLDIDFFKKINDTYGHLVGDKVLCGVSRIFVDCVRPGDLVGRYGGEEFIIMIPMSRHEEVTGIAREINRLVSQKEYLAENEKFRVTISIGISHYPHDGTSLDDLLAGADQALYWVKTHGRNGVQECWKIKQKSKSRDVESAD